MLTGAALMTLCSPLLAPQLLAFPHKAETPIGTVWSETPITPSALDKVVVGTQTRLATTPLARADEQRPIFLTDGGWRWTWVANLSRGAFAVTRPLTSAVVVNTTDVDKAIVSNGADIGGERSLSAVLAHEFTHGLIRRNYGLLDSLRFPTWKVEGYCDHVAGESSLDAADVAMLEAADIDHPALPYYHGRRRVADILNDNGGSVDDLFLSEHE